MRIRKVLSMILALTMIFCLAACGEKEEKPEGTEFVTVSFDTDGGSKITSMEVKKDSKITQPKNPEKDGFVFDKWMLGDKPFDFGTPVSENITLKATWTVDESGKKADEEAEKKAREEAEKKAKEEAEKKAKEEAEKKAQEEAEKKAKEVSSMKFRYNHPWAHVGVELDLELSTEPAEAKKYAVYKSSDESIAKVSADGIIVGSKAGDVEITATIGEKSITIPVEIVVTNTGIYTPYDEYHGSYWAQDNVMNIGAKPEPEHAMYKELTYSSSDPTVATVDSEGNITGHDIGLCTITITDALGNKKHVNYYNEGAVLIYDMPDQGQGNWSYGQVIQYEVMLSDYKDGHYTYTDMRDVHAVVGGSPYLERTLYGAGPGMYTPALIYNHPVDHDMTLELYFEVTSGEYAGLRTESFPVYLRAPMG